MKALSSSSFSLLLCLVLAIPAFGCGPESPRSSPAEVSGSSPRLGAVERTPVYTYRVTRTFAHDPEAFTQGLVFDNGALYESTGLHGESTLRRVDLETGKTLQMERLPAEYFGEGITIFGGEIIQLTWRSRVGFVYDKKTFSRQRSFRYPNEGWGLTHDGSRLIMSDGTSTLTLRDPRTFEESGRINVHEGGHPVIWLNELEYVEGEIYANVWQSDRIARISPETGRVLAWIDLTGLLRPEDRGPGLDVLNGIAYDSESRRLFVTGKRWPKLFEIELVGPK